MSDITFQFLNAGDRVQSVMLDPVPLRETPDQFLVISEKHGDKRVVLFGETGNHGRIDTPELGMEMPVVLDSDNWLSEASAENVAGGSIDAFVFLKYNPHVLIGLGRQIVAITQYDITLWDHIGDGEGNDEQRPVWLVGRIWRNRI